MVVEERKRSLSIRFDAHKTHLIKFLTYFVPSKRVFGIKNFKKRFFFIFCVFEVYVANTVPLSSGKDILREYEGE